MNFKSITNFFKSKIMAEESAETKIEVEKETTETAPSKEEPVKNQNSEKETKKEETAKKQATNTGMIILVLTILIAVIGAFIHFNKDKE